MRILIADDEGSIRLFLNRVLRKLDYEVIETCNGAEAWDTLQREKIKIVITDGITECTNKEMKQFSENRLIQTIGEAHNMSLKQMIVKTEKELRTWREDDEFQDDVTLHAIQIPNIAL